MKLTKITIRNFPLELYRRLKGYAGEHGLTIAQALTKAVEQLLTKDGNK